MPGSSESEVTEAGFSAILTHPASKNALARLALQFAPAMAGKKPIVLQTEGLGDRPFHGRIASLVDRHTASAAEMIVAFARENNLATTIRPPCSLPAHIYERTGNYDGARVSNAMAAKADQAYAASTGSKGVYMTMYYSHNLHFGAMAASMEGHCEDAMKFAEQLGANLRPMAKEMPMVEPFLGMPYAMAVRCGRWDELLAMSQPAAQTAGLKAYSLYGRGIALAAKGKLSEAEGARTQFAAVEKGTARDEIFMPPLENHTWQIVHIAGDLLAARIAAAKGDTTAAIQSLRDAVAVQDQLRYDEPADWYFPVRESLGRHAAENRGRRCGRTRFSGGS